MKGGHNIKPTEIKLSQGNAGHRPLSPETEPARLPGGIDSGLVSAEAKPHFDRLRSVLEPRGQWSTDNYLAVVQTAELIADIHELRKRIRTMPLIDDEYSPSGDYRTLAGCDQRLRMWMQEFGLTDATRSRVQIAAPASNKADPLAAYGLN